MQKDEFKTLSHFGCALWQNLGKSEYLSQETLAAVATTFSMEDEPLEKISSALVHRAKQENIQIDRQPFFKLTAEERFTLSALHVADWNYSQIARTLKTTESKVSLLAWAARNKLADIFGWLAPLPPKSLGPSCMEYDSLAPWTQVFLDEGYSAREQTYLRNHLMACEACRKTLNQCRDFYFKIDETVPKLEDLTLLEQTSKRLERSWIKLQKNQTRAISFIASLNIFFRRPEIIAATLALIGLIVIRFFR